MRTALALFLGLAAVAPPDAPPPSLSVDLDGNGAVETVTAAPARGLVRLQVRDAGARKTAEAAAPSPPGDLVHVALTPAPVGSAGSLLEVSASTDTSECVSIWRYREGTLTRLPIRGADGKDLPECRKPEEWVHRWEREGEGRPSVLVRERTEKVEKGVFRVKEVFAFAGFSLDYDPKLSVREINGVPIPSWYRATLYTRSALETLYGRFGLAAMRAEPTLSFETDPERGVFALRLTGPQGRAEAAIETYAARAGSRTATLAARVGDRTAHVQVRLAGDGTVPYEVRVEGLGLPLDQVYAPAGSWRGGSRQVFPTAADEVASEDLVGVWGDARGRNTTIEIEGAPPYRVRLDKVTLTVDMERAAPPVDLLLLPTDTSGRPWGLVLRGPNAIDRIPFACAGEGSGRECRAEGPAETLRRIGARVNVH